MDETLSLCLKVMLAYQGRAHDFNKKKEEFVGCFSTGAVARAESSGPCAFRNSQSDLY